MAEVVQKISALPSTTPTSDDQVPILDGSTTRRVTVGGINALAVDAAKNEIAGGKTIEVITDESFATDPDNVIYILDI